MKVNQHKLHLAMARKGWSLAQLAGKAGVSHATISYINNGKSCRPKTAAMIAQALEVPIEELVGEE